MFGVYFGKYLQDIGVLTPEQYVDIIETNRTARVKLGPLAVSEGYLSIEQAEEVNRIQAVKDARFGDIAIELGYMTDSQLSTLLRKQGDSYLLMVQQLVERNILNLEQIQKHINQYKKSERLTSLDLDALKSADIDKIIPIFVRDSSVPTIIKDYVALLARNIVRFIDNKVRFERIERIHTFTSQNIASQCYTGDYEIFVGLCGPGNKIVGENYAKEEFDSLDEDCLDAVCEFINVNNGLFATKLSQEEIHIDMLPPCIYKDMTTVSSEGMMFSIPCFVKNERVDIVICMETRWTVN